VPLLNALPMNAHTARAGEDPVLPYFFGTRSGFGGHEVAATTRAGSGTIASVFLHDPNRPRVIEFREPSAVDTYDFGLRILPGIVTSVLYAFEGTMVIVPDRRPKWQSWLPELDVLTPLLPSDTRSAVGEQIHEIQRIAGLSDSQLAAAFPAHVQRETINRWRNQPDPNPRRENLYRLGLLHELARRIEATGIEPRVWLHQPLRGEAVTPYELICAGRLSEVRQAVETVAAGLTSATEPMSPMAIHRDLDLVAADADEGEWIFGDSDENPG
jgi:hypothetical protein